MWCAVNKLEILAIKLLDLGANLSHQNSKGENILLLACQGKLKLLASTIIQVTNY